MTIVLPPMATTSMMANTALQPSCCHQHIWRCGCWRLLVPPEEVGQSSSPGTIVALRTHEKFKSESGHHVVVVLVAFKGIAQCVCTLLLHLSSVGLIRIASFVEAV
jgi:hypothetical protein